jgi:hypothetical protein
MSPSWLVRLATGLCKLVASCRSAPGQPRFGGQVQRVPLRGKARLMSKKEKRPVPPADDHELRRTIRGAAIAVAIRELVALILRGLLHHGMF